MVGDRFEASRSIWSARRGWGAGAGLVAIQLAILCLAPQFGAARPLAARPVSLLVGLELLAGLVWLLAVWPPSRPAWAREDLACIILIGAVLRGVMLVSTPILEDDFCRYLWDGAVVAHGANPYAHSPQEFLDRPAHASGSLARLAPVARDGASVLKRINHPSLRTIYPPLAEGAFAAAYLLHPWDLVAWRTVLLAFDAATLAFLLLLLREMGLPLTWAAIYWWNPLLIKESVNSAHMDVLILPLLLGALVLAIRGRYVGGSLLLAGATGVKLWPLILLPFTLKPLLRTPQRLALALLGIGAILGLMLWPVVRGGLSPGSGFTAYAGNWEMNDALFMGILAGVRRLSLWLGVPECAALAARGVAAAAVTAWVLWLAWQPAGAAVDLAERLLLAVAGLFLLSPTQFPWYSLWFLPLLALRPRLSLLLLNVLLPLYYLRFHFVARNAVAGFDSGIVWLEYVPVWGLLAWESWRCRRRRNATGGSRPPSSTVNAKPEECRAA